MPVINVPSGSQSGKIYLIPYDEDQWKKYDEEGQEFCKSEWIKKASVIPDVRFVVLRLIPDELFPMHGREKPYVEWQHEIDRPPECGYRLTFTVDLTILEESKYVGPVMRAEISRELEKHPKGTLWRIRNERGDVIEHGTV